MTRRSAITGVAAAALALVLSTGQAAAVNRFNSTTNLRFTAGARADKFTGHVSSPKGACKRNRDITVFRQKAGDDQRIGRATSNGQGNWTVSNGRAITGTYYAEMDSKKLNQDNVCKGDVSNTVNVFSYRTSSSINFLASNYGDRFFGSLTSPRAACKSNRRVGVFRQVPGPDELYGSVATSNAAGNWAVADGFAAAGKYYARVTQKKLDATHICRSGISPLITVP